MRRLAITSAVLLLACGGGDAVAPQPPTQRGDTLAAPLGTPTSTPKTGKDSTQAKVVVVVVKP